MKRRGLALYLTHDPRIEGSGQSLRLKFNACRTNKVGRHELYEVEVELERWTVARLCAEIAKMQERDRERIRAELNRLENEVEPIVTARK